MNTTPKPLPYPFGMMGLTIPANRPHNCSVLDTFKTGRDNPRFNGAPAPTRGRFFMPKVSSWRLGKGSLRAGRFPLSRFITPSTSRHPTGVITRVAAPHFINGATL